MLTETLKFDNEFTKKDLGCDTASFEIIGVNNVKIDTLSDGQYGQVFISSTGETIITVFVTHDSMEGRELFNKIKYALGLE